MNRTDVKPVAQSYPKRSFISRCFSRIYRSATAMWWRPRLHRLGPGTYLHHTSDLIGPSRISIGSQVMLSRGARIEAVGAGPSPQVVLEDKASIQRDVHIGACQSVTIREGTIIASGIYITDHDHDSRDPRHGYLGTGELLAAPVSIGPRAWVGERAMVLKGVTIGEGAIIGAGAVVNRDVPDYSIAVGVPAKVISKFDFEQQKWVSL